MEKRIKKITLFCLAILFFTSCVSRKQVQYFQDVDKLNDSHIYSGDKVLIKPDDRLIIRVFSSSNQDAASPFNPMMVSGGGGGGSNQTIEYLVSRKGTIDFPVLGEIHVEGLNIINLSNKLQNDISKYLDNPIVMVRIQNFTISFLGAVNGTLNVEDDQINLSQAISRVGGITNQSRIDNILVIREKNGLRSSARLDLTDSDIVNSPYYYLEQNDVVYVEPTAPARQSRGYLGTIGSYIGVVSSVLSLIVIFTR